MSKNFKVGNFRILYILLRFFNRKIQFYSVGNCMTENSDYFITKVSQISRKIIVKKVLSLENLALENMV